MTVVLSFPPLAELSERLAHLLQPLRVLEALRWSRSVEEAFFASGCRELPPVDRQSYQVPLPFDPDATREGLSTLSCEIYRRLGADHPAARMMLHRCNQGRGVIELLEARGTPRFADVSKRLYGEISPASCQSWRSAPPAPCRTESEVLTAEEAVHDADEAAQILARRLDEYFRGKVPIRVVLTPHLDARIAVCGCCLKVRRDARFTQQELRLLEVHEGWVHLGTSRNADQQRHLKFLGRVLPAATRAQEGLAVWMEILANVSNPARWRLLAARVEAVLLAEEGADFLEVYRHFGKLDLSPRECYHLAARVFRGSLPAGAGPFTKDLAYALGFAEVGAFLREAPASHHALLFCGKVSLADIPALVELTETGLVQLPRFVPALFSELSDRLSKMFGTDLRPTGS